MLESLSCLVKGSCLKDKMMDCQKVNFVLIQMLIFVNTIMKQLTLPSIIYRLDSNSKAMQYLEQLLLKACQRKDITLEVQHACSFYKDNFQPELLRAQLKTFGIEFERTQTKVYGGHNTNEPTIF